MSKESTKNGRKNSIVLEKIKIVQFSICLINAKTIMNFARHVISSGYFFFLEQRRSRAYFSRGSKSRTSWMTIGTKNGNSTKFTCIAIAISLKKKLSMEKLWSKIPCELAKKINFSFIVNVCIPNTCENLILISVVPTN